MGLIMAISFGGKLIQPYKNSGKYLGSTDGNNMLIRLKLLQHAEPNARIYQADITPIHHLAH